MAHGVYVQIKDESTAKVTESVRHTPATKTKL